MPRPVNLERTTAAANTAPAVGSLASPARRRALQALGACMVAWPQLATATAEPRRLRASRALMGTQVELALQGRDAPALQVAATAALDRMATLAAAMSHYSATSRVAALNHAAGLQPVPVPPEMMAVLQMARAISRRSGGAFDITVGSVGQWDFTASEPSIPSPIHIAGHLRRVDYRQVILDQRANTAMLAQRGMRVDLGGIAKLYILDAGMDTLRQHGVNTALINGGGDVLAATEAAARPWRVGVRNPHQPGRLLGTIDVRRGFVASSGDYERCFVREGRLYHHVLDPRTGYPSQSAHGVTLVADALESVNGLGTAAMVLEDAAGRHLIETTAGMQALVARRDGSTWMTAGMAARLQAAPSTRMG
jgi:thiamine biosynthesis lipoprotein